jgi:gliding motility-associated-like protein
LSAGTYTIIVTDAHGCTSTQSISVTQPSVLTASAQNDSVCAGQAVVISASGTGGIPPYTYSWSNGPTTPSQSVNPLVTTSYTVTVTDANSCSNTAVSTVTINGSPSAVFSTNAVNGIFTLNGPGSQLCFTGPSGVSSWLWDLNGAGTSTQQSPCVPVTSADVGPFCATLTVSNAQGCIDTASVCVEINDVYYSIPNVFTPDGDGVNEGFVITNMGMKSLRCKIYDRWGVLVYEWDGTAGYWNGQTKGGKDAVDGVYYYTVFMQDFQDKTYDESGFVQLIRGK